MLSLLVVDDNENNVELLKIYLERQGFNVLTGQNGQEAIEQVIKYHPALVLMDLRMPYMSGWEATQRIKTRPESKTLPIIAFSAYIGPEDSQRLRRAGFDDYIIKPLDLRSNMLLDKIRRLTGSSQKQSDIDQVRHRSAQQ